MKKKRISAFFLTIALLSGSLSSTAYAATWYMEDGDVIVSASESGQTVSLQESLEADGDSALTLADVIQDGFCMEECCEKKADLLRVRQLLETLPARERQILLLRYGLAGQPPLTQLETAQLLGISRSYVSRLESHALCQLRQYWDKKPAQE